MRNDKIGSQIHEPSDDEINETIGMVKDRYDICITKEDAIALSKLYQEFEWWLVAEKEAGIEGKIDEKIAAEIQGLARQRHKVDIGLDVAHADPKKILAFGSTKEKDRLATEIRAIIAKYK